MELKRKITVNKPIEQVWDILGNQYGAAYQWASGLYYSEGLGTPTIEEAPHNNRTCETSFGPIKEKIRVFDPEQYILSYEVIEGFPSFVETGINNWRLLPLGNQTVVSMHLTIMTRGYAGAFMGPLMKLQMSKTLSQVIEDFKHFVETGKPSPRKLKELQKHARKAA